ncbi:MAG: DNA methyltransferase C1 [Thermoanaerobacterales bacterium 50_218]|nr:MAG: DNA methyltransferase C1 [Thermoanaerobacterales bacterium 50_218]
MIRLNGETGRNHLFEWKEKEKEYLKLLDQKYSFSEALKALDEIDWDFKNFNTQYLSHKFHPYPARFIPQIPLTFIKLFTEEGDTVLDPFCGCGTTLVEALLNSRNAVGNDLNPLAVLISKVKTTLIPEEKLHYLHRKLQERKKGDPDSAKIARVLKNLPNRKISKIFDETTIEKLELLREVLLELRIEGENELCDLGSVALSATVWSLVENRSTGDVEEQFLKKLRLMESELKKMAALIKHPPRVEVLNDDARKLAVASGSVDLIVTSPPYVNAFDYYRSHMYNMIWLDMDFGAFKKQEIGGHSQFVNNRFRLLSRYLGDMLRALIEMNRVLKKGHLCVIVIGNSSLEYEAIESHKFFAAMAACTGFKNLKTIPRSIDKTRKYTSSEIGKIEDEYLILLQKTAEVEVSASDDDFVTTVVEQQMHSFREKVKEKPGTGVRGKKPSEERLKKNIEKLDEAIAKIAEDIRLEK